MVSASCVATTDIGTALNQIDEKNGDDVVDECTGIVVMNNEIDTQACVL